MKSYKELVEYALAQDMEVQVEHENSAYLTVLKWSHKKSKILKAIEKHPMCMVLLRTSGEHQSVGWVSIKSQKKDERSLVMYSLYTDNHPLYPKKGFIDNWFRDLPNERKDKV
jgi:hypothetical protein